MANIVPGPVTTPSRRVRRRSRARGATVGGPATGTISSATGMSAAHGANTFAKMDALTAYTRGRIHGIVDEYCVLGNLNFQQGWKNLGL